MGNKWSNCKETAPDCSHWQTFDTRNPRRAQPAYCQNSVRQRSAVGANVAAYTLCACSPVSERLRGHAGSNSSKMMVESTGAQASWLGDGAFLETLAKNLHHNAQVSYSPHCKVTRLDSRHAHATEEASIFRSCQERFERREKRWRTSEGEVPPGAPVERSCSRTRWVKRDPRNSATSWAVSGRWHAPAADVEWLAGLETCRGMV